MSVTAKQVWEAYPLLAELCRNKQPYQVARRISRILKVVKGHYEDINEAREALVAEKTGEEGTISNREAVSFSREWREELSKVIEAFELTPVSAKDFTDKWEVSPDTLLSLLEIGAIVEEEDK